MQSDVWIITEVNTMELNERLKEISAELYCVKVAARSVDNPNIIDDALTAIIREIDNIVDEEKEKV